MYSGPSYCWHQCFETLHGARSWVLNNSRDSGNHSVERREFPVRNRGNKDGGRKRRGVSLGDSVQLCWSRVIVQTGEGGEIDEEF